GIGNMECDQIVTPAGVFQRALEAPIQKITEQEGNAASADDSIQVVQPMLDTRAFADGLKVEDVANEAESMAKPFVRWHEPLHRVGKGDQADFVVVADGTESQDSS